MSLLAARCKAIKRIQASNPQLSEGEIFSKLVSYTSTYVSIQITALHILIMSLSFFFLVYEQTVGHDLGESFKCRS